MIFSRRLLLLGLGLAAQVSVCAAATVCAANSQQHPFTAPGKLELLIAPAHEPRPDSLSAGFVAGPDTNTFVRFPNPFGPDGEVASVALQGVVRDHLGGLSMDFKFRFTWRDAIRVNDGPKGYSFSRKELAAYPSLLRRFQSAHPTFDHIELSFHAKPRTAVQFMEQNRIEMTLPENHFLYGLEGEWPASSPSIPPKWGDRMTMFGSPNSRVMAEEEVVKRWSELASVHCAFVKVVGLKIPRAEFLAIAKLLEAYQKGDKELEKEYAVLTEGLGKTSVPAYTRQDDGARPIEPPNFSAEIVKGLKKGVALSSRGRTVWQSADYHGIRPLGADGRFFVVFHAKGQRIVNARGVVQAFDGTDTFNQVSPGDRPGQHKLARYDENGSPVFQTHKDYTSFPNGLTDAQFRELRSRDGDGRCRASSLKSGEVGIHLGRRLAFVRGRQYVVDERAKLLESREAYYTVSDRRPDNNRKICND